MTRIDPIVFRRLRLAAEISEAEAGRRSGVSATIVALIESGETKGHMTLAAAGRLAAAIGVHLADVLEQEVETPIPNTQEERDRDAVLLESLLFVAGKRIHLAAVAAATGWSVERARTAADKLHEQLEDRGIRLNRTGQTCGLRPRVDTRTKEQLSAIERQVAIRDGLLLPEAAILHRVWRQELTGSTRAVVRDARTRLAVARLINVGAIVMRPTHSAQVIEEGETRTVNRFRLGTDVLMALAPVRQPSQGILPVQPSSGQAPPV